MSHMKIFLTSHLSTIRTRNHTIFRYNFVPYGHVLVPMHVPLRILQLVDIQEIVAPYSYKRPFHIIYFVLLILVMIY